MIPEMIAVGFARFSGMIAFLSNLVTVILGGIALWGLLFRRQQLLAFVSILKNAYFSQRIGRLKETLGKLDSLSFNDKESRPELKALMGQICGQLGSLVVDYPRFQSVFVRLSQIVDGKPRLTEPLKRKLVYEIHGLIDDEMHNSHQQALHGKAP